MVIIYPALTSSSVSSHVLPGICKALEKYIIVYRIDSILKKKKKGKSRLSSLKQGSKQALKKASVGAFRENFVWIDEQEHDLLDPSEQPSQPERDTEDKNKKDKFDVSTPKLDQAISVEPTWLLVSGKEGEKVLVGVKVIAFPVKSDTELSNLILNDRVRYGLGKFLYSASRGFVRRAFKIFKRWMPKTLTPDIPVTGDPTRDVLLASSSHGEDVFVILNSIDIPGDEFFRSATGVKKLFSLGWGSFAIVDDVNKKATFCMKEFKGLCSSVGIANIFATIGKEQHQVYKDAEEVKASASPFFHMSTNIRRLASESAVNEKLEKYLTEL